MNVTIICDVLGKPNNGTALAAFNLIAHLKSAGHSVTVVAPDAPDGEGFVSVPRLNLGPLNRILDKNGVSLAKPDKKLLEAGNYDMCYCEVRLNGDFDLSKLLSPGASLNYGAVSDTQLDELITAYLSAGDSDRKTACDNMCAYIANKAYIVPLIFERHQLVSHRGVIEGAKANENNPLCNIENWTVKIESVKKSEDTTKN